MSDPNPTAPRGRTVVQARTHAMFVAILRRTALALAALLVVGVVAGWLISGWPGVWGALLGAGLGAAYLLTTVAVMLATNDKPVQLASAGVAGAWLVKVILTLGLMIFLRGRDFYDARVLFVAVVLAVLVTIGIEAAAVLNARIPTVDTGALAADAADAADAVDADQGPVQAPERAPEAGAGAPAPAPAEPGEKPHNI